MAAGIGMSISSLDKCGNCSPEPRLTIANIVDLVAIVIYRCKYASNHQFFGLLSVSPLGVGIDAHSYFRHLLKVTDL